MLNKGGQPIRRIYGETAEAESVREREAGGIGGQGRLLRSCGVREVCGAVEPAVWEEV